MFRGKPDVLDPDRAQPFKAFVSWKVDQIAHVKCFMLPFMRGLNGIQTRVRAGNAAIEKELQYMEEAVSERVDGTQVPKRCWNSSGDYISSGGLIQNEKRQSLTRTSRAAPSTNEGRPSDTLTPPLEFSLFAQDKGRAHSPALH